MRENDESWLFALTLAAAAAVLVSIALSETLLALTCLVWIVKHPVRSVWPSFFVPLCAFMFTTVLALAVSQQPLAGRAVIYKFWLFTMSFLAANFVITPTRARVSHAILLATAAAASSYGLAQFAMRYWHFQYSPNLVDDPTVNARITGLMGHWITFSAEQLLVWCAALPALVVLGRRWIIPMGIVGTALVLSFTRSVWLGAIAAFLVIAAFIPRKVLIAAALPIAVVGLAASGLIYHRVSVSFSQPNFAPDTGRMELFLAGVRMVRDHPLFGVGPERIHAEFPKYYRGSNLADAHFFYGHLENNVMQIAAERGLLCLAAFLWLIFELYASLIAMVRTAADETRWTAVSALAALTGFLVSGFFEYNFGDSEVLLLLLFIVSLPFGMSRDTAEERTAVPNTPLPNAELTHV